MNQIATSCVTADRLLPQPGGGFTVRVEHGVLSVQPDGRLETRPAGTDGPWEVGRRVDNKLVFSDPAYPTGSYALLVIG